MYYLRRITILFACLAILVFLLWLLPRVLNPTPPDADERRRDTRWVDTSPYWIDRQACRWLSLCGVHHLRWDDPAEPRGNSSEPDDGGELLGLELRSLWGDAGNKGRESRSWETASYTHGKKAQGTSRGKPDSREIPDYVLAHAPLVHLYSGENFWPSDIAEHIKHMSPYTNGAALNSTHPLTLQELHKLNRQAADVFLTSKVDIETRPEWLSNRAGVPSPFEVDGVDEAPRFDDTGDTIRYAEGTTWYDVDRSRPLHRISDPRRLRHKSRWGPSKLVPRAILAKLRGRHVSASQHAIKDEMGPPPTPRHKPDGSGYSKAPAVLVMVDKGSGILDAFWFFFYSYNLGQTVLNIRFGNHIGDWEHCMVRFENGVPRAMFLSEHAGGQAYAWGALEKYRAQSANGTFSPERPVIYSAVGSHAMYALPGSHPYVLPFKMLKDVTDKGPLWDPAKNNYAYFFDYVRDREESQDNNEEEPTSLTPVASNSGLATSWFHFAGPWGDELYSLGDRRQWRLFGQYHYITGPLGPKFKNLDRSKVCQTPRCKILFSLDAGKKGTWYS